MNEKSPIPLSPQEPERREMSAMVRKVQSKVNERKPFYQLVADCQQILPRGTKPTDIYSACFIACLIAHNVKEDVAYSAVVTDRTAVDKYLDENGVFVGTREAVTSPAEAAAPVTPIKRKVLRTKIPQAVNEGKKEVGAVEPRGSESLRKKLEKNGLKLQKLHALRDELDDQIGLAEKDPSYGEVVKKLDAVKELWLEIVALQLVNDSFDSILKNASLVQENVFPRVTDSKESLPRDVDSEVLEIHRLMFNFLNGKKVPYEDITLDPRISELVMDIERKLPPEIYPYLRKVLAYLDLAILFSEKVFPKKEIAKFLARFHNEFIDADSVTVERILTNKEFMRTVFALMEKKLVEGSVLAPSTAFTEAFKQRTREIASQSSIKYTADKNSSVTVVRPGESSDSS